uniref:Uncharacterized protein n=1 Tax=Anguilla anguilla TaxID=7936 RepID=A0A0E9RVG3_ANGAN
MEGVLQAIQEQLAQNGRAKSLCSANEQNSVRVLHK